MFIIKKCFTNNSNKKIIIENEKLFFGWQMESDKNNVVQKELNTKYPVLTMHLIRIINEKYYKFFLNNVIF